ncbi:ATP-dependent Clp protease ATP-binding subunit [Petrocella sp. FN5]|uniref:ATP-dependent Clp protease ATP-binding subunit n=1 Tax=Petrocella sp. FN5 TaxID=3032002 RepID=UPI0023DA448B|nr:ATP-dependent Clp protease ATP-binding subunit [Petrocella sp. FN5]MDF1616518.1 ATP-dependent Clp protease ATP-binding subunit [Petrocella sp. FN5]
MKCSMCRVNTAIVFVTKMENGIAKREGLCIPCAQKQGLAPLDAILQQTGMSQEEFDNISEQMTDIFEDVDMDQLTESFTKPDEHGKNHISNLFNSAFSKNNKDEDMTFKQAEQETQDGTVKTKVKKTGSPKRKNLDAYGINLNEKALNHEVDRIIGRHREIDRVIQILNRRTKNNPVLIGEPGVGKTAIAEGLAVRIVEGQVPTKLLNVEVYLLDLTSVVAGTQFRGQFETRMKAILKEATTEGNIILVIDEVHSIVGAGEAEGGTMNAANILKPALAKGEVQIVGATTLEEYRKHIEKDSALERRFQPVIVDEPSVEDSIEIIKGIKDYYEDYHKVHISEAVIIKAVMMSERYISDRFLPDKAIDVIDEAGSRANLLNEGLVELEALKNELQKIVIDKEDAAANDDYERAADCKVEELRLNDKIAKIEKECKNVAITEEDIAYVIEAWTKIPVKSIAEDEAYKLINLEERLHRRIIGQEEAVKKLSRATRRSRSGFSRRKKPSSFVFVGPTGVGKTELSKALASELFGNEEALIRFDMSEFMEKHTVSKLIGAPPGYVGYDQAGQLTEKVRRRPYSVLLLDEIEKAHTDVFNLLLQILEDGRLTDGQGRTVNFENTVIIMTSNAGTSHKNNGIGFGNGSYASLEQKTKDALKEVFKPEFLNRIDETIVFTELSKNELKDIIELMLKDVLNTAKDKRMSLTVDQEVKAFILENGYDPKFGARPLRRAIQQYVEDELAECYIKGMIKEGDHIEVYMGENEPKVRVQESNE